MADEMAGTIDPHLERVRDIMTSMGISILGEAVSLRAAAFAGEWDGLISARDVWFSVSLVG
jgi:hypothetical protein